MSYYRVTDWDTADSFIIKASNPWLAVDKLMRLSHSGLQCVSQFDLGDYVVEVRVQNGHRYRVAPANANLFLGDSL